MKHKLAMAGLLFPIMLATMPGQADERRGIYVDAGIGFANTSYTEELDDSLDLAENNGFDRVTMSLDLDVGWAVRQNLYLVGSITTFADRVYRSSDYLQLNTYLTAVGVRYYPLASMKHLQIGADFGVARLAVRASESEYNDLRSDDGSGFKLSIAYDFDSTLRGPAFMVGAEMLQASIEHEKFTGVSLFARFVFK